MDIPILYSDDRREVEVRSSILQHKDKLSVKSQGGFLPISYDVLDTIGCDGTKWHRAILSLDEHDLGYTFPIADCPETVITKLLSDKYGVTLEELPSWYGSGLYQKFIDGLAIAEGDNGTLGEKNKINYKIGLECYLAKKTIEGVA